MSRDDWPESTYAAANMDQHFRPDDVVEQTPEEIERYERRSEQRRVREDRKRKEEIAAALASQAETRK
jgi:hypothetical protein